MMNTALKYLSIYKEFFTTSLSEDMSFRANFILQSIMNVSFIGVYFFTSVFIFDHIEHIGLWRKEEFLFFLSFALAVDQIHYLFFSFNFWMLSDDIRMGNLDFHLLKPAAGLFIALLRRAAVPGVFTALLTAGMLIYFGIQAELSFLAWASLPFCLLLAISLLLGAEVLISLFNFVSVEGMGVNQMRLQLQHLCRWPDFIYKNPLRLWLLPFLAVTSVPVRWILDFNYWSWLLIMLAGSSLLWAFVIFIWPKCLRFYESPSS